MTQRFRFGLAAVTMLAFVVGCSDKPPTPEPSRPPVALGPVSVIGVGDLAQGGTSKETLVLEFTEASPAAIATGSGSFQVTLTDQAGRTDTISFTGTPEVRGAPDSLGASVVLNSPNGLTVTIADSDVANLEPFTIAGLGIKASPTAAIGPINAVIGGCTGSLVGCAASTVLPAPGNVVAPR